MNWNADRLETIKELERAARLSGNFVGQAIVREIRSASARYSATDSSWSEVVNLAQRWEQGMPGLEVLDAVRRINRGSSCGKTEPPSQSP